MRVLAFGPANAELVFPVPAPPARGAEPCPILRAPEPTLLHAMCWC